MNTVVFIVSHDSQLKWAKIVADEFKAHDWTVNFLAISEYNELSENQITDAGLHKEEVLVMPHEYCYEIIFSHDVCFFLTPGGNTERILFSMLKWHESRNEIIRPLIVSAYVGLVLNGHAASFLFRSLADVICVNNKYDYKLFNEVCRELDIGDICLKITGLAIIPYVKDKRDINSIYRVVFADQTIIPKQKHERIYIYQNLLDYALAYPERLVVIKPRYRVGETSFHKGKFSPEQFFHDKKCPPNLIFDYSPLTEQLPDTDLLITMSSTAALEAAVYGVKVAIIADLGIKEEYGNQIFIGSRLVRTFAQILNDDLGTVDEAWLNAMTAGIREPARKVFEMVKEQLPNGAKYARSWPMPPYSSSRQVLLDLRARQSPSHALQAKPDARSYGIVHRFLGRIVSQLPFIRAYCQKKSK